MELMHQAALPRDLVTLVIGGAASARLVMGDPGIDAITLTGGPAAGHAAHRLAILRHVPLQAELGGNNAAIVWSDADQRAAAGQIAAAAFGFAGQRCTANRRVIVERSHMNDFLGCLGAATRSLAWGDPLDDATVVGPVISEDSRERVQLAIEEARRNGWRILTPHRDGGEMLPGDGWYVAPVIVVCPDAQASLVQRESFGPVLVVQPADDWDHAVELLNGVPQGLVAAVFTASADRWRDFQDRAMAGILKWNRATADAGVEAPFGGWKASGVGPPEHGPADAEFFTRTQALYTA
jgi:acyl-CoA reductase-like NAD-dependent aldehyde dehydrogenase